MAVSAAFSLASNPFFCVPVNDEALTLEIRFWITACGVSTVTVKLHDDWLPYMSVAVCVTVLVPIGKTDPLANDPAFRVTDCTAQLSVAVGVAYVAIAPVGQLG